MRMPKTSEIKAKMDNKGKFINEAFKIVSPKDYVLKTEKEIEAIKQKMEEEKQADEEEAQDGSSKRKDKKSSKTTEEDPEAQEEEEDLEPWVVRYDPKTCQEITRWQIPAKRTIRLFIKYWNTKTTSNSAPQKATFRFECFFANGKKLEVNVTGITGTPSISRNPGSVFKNKRKFKPKGNKIQLHHVWLKSDNLFEFGPLLIGKNPEERQTE